MLKQKTLDIGATNIANMGSALEHNIKHAAAEQESAWKNSGKAPGIQIWRIEKFHVKEVANNTYGSFYSGDSYIVLHTYKKKADSDALSWDIHFWLGQATTQDEAGTAAYKTVELDDHLNGAAVQYREVQEHESTRFLGYFPKGIRIFDGGVESGFHHVKPEDYRPRLLQLKGKRHVRVTEVPLTHKSLNSGDVFLLDAGLRIIQWDGKSSSGGERIKAQQLAIALVEERNGHPHHVTIDEGSDDEEFFTLLGGRGPVASAAEGGDDAQAEAAVSKLIHLFKLHEADGKVTFTQVAEGDKIKKSALESNDVFILDTGVDVIVWVGKHANVGEKKHSLQFAQDYLNKHNKPVFTPISRVLEESEHEVLNQYLH